MKSKTFQGSFWDHLKEELRSYDWKGDYPLWTVVTIIAVAFTVVNQIALILIPIVVLSSVFRCCYRTYKNWTYTGPYFYFLS
ncbi:MAG: hypothetical protein ACXABD_05975 [Candidatus Thorarchaeota archaeon]|jgi:hypothetical protein